MNHSPSTALSIFNSFLELISNNSYLVTTVILAFIFRKPLSNLITRITSFSYKNGDSTIGLNASTNKESVGAVLQVPEPDEKPHHEDDSFAEESTDNWYVGMQNALHRFSFDEADEIIRLHVLTLDGDSDKADVMGFYLFSKYEKKADPAIFEELEELARVAKTDAIRFQILMWIDTILVRNSDQSKLIEFITKLLKDLNSTQLRFQIIATLATALNTDEKSDEAHALVIENLRNFKSEDESQKFFLYSALSIIERTLGNNSLAVYSKDKSLEYAENNNDGLFDAAYSAGNEDIDEISICNYSKLIRFDSKNGGALNNLGVKAQEADLNIIAIANYKKSAEEKHSLAMANKGYALLKAGFADEAESIAKEAIELGDPHKNIYSLMTAIEEGKDKQAKLWDKLLEKAETRHKLVRQYTEQYYTGSPNTLVGDWMVGDKYYVSTIVEHDTFTTSWTGKNLNSSSNEFNAKLSGKVTGSTFKGHYTMVGGNKGLTTLSFDGNITHSCIGFISHDGRQITIISAKFEDEFSLTLSKSD
jgi:tetratricopeptide (TPR) repeat protein